MRRDEIPPNAPTVRTTIAAGATLSVSAPVTAETVNDILVCGTEFCRNSATPALPFHPGNQNTSAQVASKREKPMKSAIRAAALLAGCFLPSITQAQVQQPGNLYDFGDSFQDGQYWCTSFGTPLHACSNYRNTPMHLGSLSNYAFSLRNDFAIGATASGSGTIANTGTPPYPGYTATYPNAIGQIAQFQALGNRIGPRDLVMLSYAGNDVTVYGNPGAALAQTVIGNLTGNVQTLIGLGARNFVLLGGVPLDRLPAGGPSMLEQSGISPAGDREYYTTLNARLPAALAQFASASVQLRILDANTLYNRVLDTPAMYGFTFGDCDIIAGCASAPLAVQNQYAFYRGHPSDAFAQLIASYIENLLTMPYQIAAEADLAQSAALAFHDSLTWRLSAEHLRFAGPESAARPAVGRLAVFASGNYAYADRSDRKSASGGNANAGGLTVGADTGPRPTCCSARPSPIRTPARRSTTPTARSISTPTSSPPSPRSATPTGSPTRC